MSNTDSRQIARNALASYTTLATQVVSGLVVTPLLFRSLGAPAFGTYALLVSITAYVGFFELGVGTATLRLVAERTAAGKDLRAVLGSSRSLYLTIVTFSAFAFIPVAIYAPTLPGASGATTTQARIVILALAMSGLFGLLMNVYPAYVYGTGRADVLYRLGTVTNILMAASQVLVAISHGGIVLLGVVTAGVTGFNTILAWVLAKRMLGSLRARARDADASTRRHLLRFGIKNAAVSVLATLSQQSDLVIVGAFLPAGRVAAYALASRVAAFAKSIATRAADVLVPTFADAAARGDDDRQFRLVVDASLFGSAVLYPIALVFLLFGDDLLKVWLGTVPPHTHVILTLLVAAAAVQVLGGVGWVFFNGRGELDIFLRVGSVVAVANVAASVILTLVVGVVGPAISTFAAIVLFDAVVIPPAVAQRLSRAPLELLRDVFQPLGPALAVAAAVGLTAQLTLDGRSAGAMVTAAVFTTLVFYGVLFISVGSARRQRYARMARPRKAT